MSIFRKKQHVKNKANTALVGKILQSIADHPEEHDQSHWVRTYDLPVADKGGECSLTLADFEEGCGTAACVAGWTLLHDGWKFQFDVLPGSDPEVVQRAVKGDKELCDWEYSFTAASLLAGEDFELRDEIRHLFQDMSRERVIAKLAFVYFNGYYPTWGLTLSGDRRFEGLKEYDFINKWHGEWYDHFIGEE